MKNSWKAYRTFASRGYCIFCYLVIPACLILWHGTKGTLFGVQDINVVSNSLVLLLAAADYMTLNGVNSSKYGFGILRCTSKGQEHLERALYMDFFIRFVVIAVIDFICGIISYQKYRSDFNKDMMIMHVIVLFVTFACINITVFISRFFTTMVNFMFVTYLVVSLLVVGTSVGLIYGFSFGHYNPVLWLLGGIVLSVISVYAAKCYVLYNYRRSFLEGK